VVEEMILSGFAQISEEVIVNRLVGGIHIVSEERVKWKQREK
jgi:hypothetical protein